MKILCLLLSFCIIILSAKPCCADKDCNSKALSSKVQNNKQASPEKECPGCSPFFTCGSCAGFIVNKPLTTTQPVMVETADRQYSCYHQPAIKNMPVAIWLPPKLS